MSKKTVAELFSDKIAKVGSALGRELSPITFDSAKNRHYQLFEHGVIIGRKNDISRNSDLICVHGRLFAAWWQKPGGEWLGEPLEDLYETKNFEGSEIMVQRFEKGVISCRSDGEHGVNWLSWRDWHAVSYPGNEKDTPPKG